ncbi:MAG: integration host factor subunit beta [Candidatus Brocadiales bacterium]|nr:integration host factor subunit beta [Candidatus Brocadiales bacterium]
MTKADLVDKVAHKIKLNKKQAEDVINALINSISDSLSEGGKVEIRGFGSFRIRERNARTARNPKSGEMVEVPAKKVPFFKAGKELRAMVDAEGFELS